MITVKEYTTAERLTYREEQYKIFLDYYLNSELPVAEIYNKMGIHQKNNVAKYIRRRLREENYNPSKRVWQIKKGEWLKKQVN